MTRLGILYGGSGILGACGSPDYLDSRHDYGRIVVLIMMVFIGYGDGGSDVPG